MQDITTTKEYDFIITNYIYAGGVIYEMSYMLEKNEKSFTF